MTTKIGVVGDLSGNSPDRLCKVVDNALIACDIVVQVGDLEPAYTQMQSRYLTSGHKFFPVPGNHDADYDSIGAPRNWRFVSTDGLVTLIGLDSSTGKLPDEAKAQFKDPKSTPFEFVFSHMAPSALVLPDGSENTHSMIESGPNPDADWLIQQLQSRADCMCVGHYHGWTLQFSTWGPLIVDGRGGAAADLGYTLITVTSDGWVVHSVGIG